LNPHLGNGDPVNSQPDIADHPARILIVDDERLNKRLLEVMLVPQGFHILSAASGEEALAMVEQQPPDLILLDIMMPGIDGYEVARKLKSNLATKNIPIIMVTALNDRNARMRGLSAGAEDFLTKPVDHAELCVRVRNLLRLKAYGDHYDKYSQVLEGKVKSRTADLVERTKALEEQAVVLTEQAALLDLAQDAIVVRDMHDRILFWNRGAEVLYGWLSMEALGSNTRELLATEFTEPAEAIEAQLLREDHWEGEAVHHQRDGTRLIVASRWALQRDADGAPVRILTINMDVTERKEAERALEQSRADQLQFKDDFLSHVSHELRSPLTAIKQFTSILLSGLAGELNKEQREYQEIVLKNVRQLQSMIDDLLEVTRLETGKLTVEPESASIANAVTDTFDTLQGTARAKGVTLSCDLPPDLPRAYADQTRLRQILILLLDNAIKFTPDGGAVIIQARALQDDPRLLLIEVSDDGCGISPEMAGRVFERLYQTSPATVASRNGLGLGLYICKELVTRQGGSIWVERRPQKGTTFSFTLPVFSLDDSIAPLLKHDKWPAKSVALVVVYSPDAWRSKESRDEWSRQARELIQRCLLPDLDVLLPRMSSGAEGERFFVAAFADEKGASALVKRLREQFERHLKHPGRRLSVSHRMLQAIPRDIGTSVENMVTRLAANLADSIESQISSEAVHHE
jgi:PAS domain S-box-containing protein